MDLRTSEIFLLLQCGDRLESSESDVCRRQILTSKVDPRTVRVNLAGLYKRLPGGKMIMRNTLWLECDKSYLTKTWDLFLLTGYVIFYNHICNMRYNYICAMGTCRVNQAINQLLTIRVCIRNWLLSYKYMYKVSYVYL